jgi:hypothetical protein
MVLGPVRPVLGSLKVLGRALMVLRRPKTVLGMAYRFLGVKLLSGTHHLFLGPSQAILERESPPD